VARDVPEALRTAVVRDIDDQPVHLATLWAERPVVLVLLRHFGCLFCKEQAAQMSAVGNEIEAAGARLVFVGSGSAQYAKWFQEDYAPRYEVYSDAELVTYQALGAKHGFLSSVNPWTWWYSLRAMLHGHFQSGTRGEQTQQGAVAVITPAGEMPYLHISQVAGDHPRPRDVVGAVRGLRG
jgi:peroxiredoxin